MHAIQKTRYHINILYDHICGLTASLDAHTQPWQDACAACANTVAKQSWMRGTRRPRLKSNRARSNRKVGPLGKLGDVSQFAIRRCVVGWLPVVTRSPHLWSCECWAEKKAPLLEGSTPGGVDGLRFRVMKSRFHWMPYKSTSTKMIRLTDEPFSVFVLPTYRLIN